MAVLIKLKAQNVPHITGFLYYKHLSGLGTTNWICRRKKECLERAITFVYRILIFATTENLRYLARSSTWSVDGTFKTAPTIFFQLFAILAAVSQV